VSVDAAQLWTSNHRVLVSALAACDGELTAVRLEPKEFFVLVEVGSSPYPAELAAALIIPRATMTAYVRNLVAKGYLRREIDPSDLRRHRLALTPEGTAARDHALAALSTAFDRRLARLGAADRAELQRLLALVDDAREDRRSSSSGATVPS
jgi:DNA-binding MarR family transcriptional regulator